MVEIPTNARTTVHVNVNSSAVQSANDAWRALHRPGDSITGWASGLQPYLIEFTPSNGDLVRLYSVDGEPNAVIVETYETEGDLTLECHVGPHGAATLHATSMPLEIRAGATPPDELVFDVV